MQFRIGKFDPDTGAVPVTFRADGFLHRRQVVAVLDQAGRYDARATRQRVEAVAQGVAAKRAAGALAGS